MARTLITFDQLAGGILTSQLEDGAEFIQRDGSVAMTANLSLGSNRITNVADPSADTDGANKQYVDNKFRGFVLKDSVRAATTANIALSGTQTIDGVALSVSDRVLVKNQTTAEDNGIYVVAAGAWARSTDADADAEVKAGLTVFVSEGTANGNELWSLSTDDPIVVGTTELVFTQTGGNVASYLGGAGMTLDGNTFNVNTASTARIVVNADNIDLATVSQGTGGSFVKVTIDSYGRITDNQAVGSSDITTALGYTPVNNAKLIWNEAIGGTVNGVNTSFTIAAAPVAGKLQLYVNGQLQKEGAGNDFTISGTTISMEYAPKTGSVLTATYLEA